MCDFLSLRPISVTSPHSPHVIAVAGPQDLALNVTYFVFYSLEKMGRRVATGKHVPRLHFIIFSVV
jgi:hypothetical protein